jgi:hypothetical protein
MRIFCIGFWVLLQLAVSPLGAREATEVKCSATLSAFIGEGYVVFQFQRPDENSQDVYVFDKKECLSICAPDTANARLVLREQAEGWVLDHFDHYLLMDYGCCPDGRTLSIVDIRSGKHLLDTSYVEPVVRRGSSISFWLQSSDDSATECEEAIEEYQRRGLSGALEYEHLFDVQSLKLVKTENWRCVARQ